MKRILALLLVALMAVSMLSALADEPRNITLAVWWDMYYDSDDEGWEEDSDGGDSSDDGWVEDSDDSDDDEDDGVELWNGTGEWNGY